jgi:hypothetical protein
MCPIVVELPLSPANIPSELEFFECFRDGRDSVDRHVNRGTSVCDMDCECAVKR